MHRLPSVVVVAAVVLVVAALRLGRDFFIPLALSGVVCLLLSPVVNFLEARRWKRVPAVLLVTIVAFSGVGLLALVVTRQVMSLAQELPQYRRELETKVATLHGPISKLVHRARETVKETTPDEPPLAGAPLKVEVVENGPDPLSLAGGAISPLLDLGEAVAVVSVLVVFLLIYRFDLVDRVIRIVGVSQINLTTQALSETARGVSRYLLTQTWINGSFGLFLGGILYFIGVPHAALWGLLAALMRYIPYVGPLVAGILPVLFAVAVFPGWERAAAVAGVVVVLELISNNLIEPWAYGNRTGLSPFAVILSAFFWAWLWGPVGLFLSVPLSVCLAAVGRHASGLRFIAVFLGSEPPLSPPVSLYNRVLAGRSAQALELLEKERDGKSFEQLCDALFLPSLVLVETDLVQGRLDPDKAEKVCDAIGDLARTAAEHFDERRDAPEPRSDGGATRGDGATTLCLASSERTDEVGARILADALGLRGCAVEVPEGGALTGEKAAQVESFEPAVVCISAVPPSSLLRLRYLYKRVRQGHPDLPVIVALWGWQGDLAVLRRHLLPDGKGRIVVSLEEAAREILEELQSHALRDRAARA